MDKSPGNCTEEKALKWETRACPMALAGVLLTGAAVYARWVMATGRVDVHACGQILQWCLYVLFGICGGLYMPGDKENRCNRIGVWGGIQVGMAWGTAVMAAAFSRMNDGVGLGFVIFCSLADPAIVPVVRGACVCLAGGNESTGLSPGAQSLPGYSAGNHGCACVPVWPGRICGPAGVE